MNWAATWAALGLLLAGGAALAQPRPQAPGGLPGVGAEDPRRTVDRATAPWASLGRVQLEIGGRCTGALVGPRLVLTAAHCLVSSRSQALVRPSSVHFLLGYDRGQYVAHARVTGFRTGNGYRPDGSGGGVEDWAVLTLEAPGLPAGLVLPLVAGSLPARTALMLGGYQQDRPEVLLADIGCRALGISPQDGMLLHDCAGTLGVSGGPLLARLPGGGWAVAGIASRVAPRLSLGVAVPATAFASWVPR